MTFCVENEIGATLPFDVQRTVEVVAGAILDAENCPYEVEINILLTDNNGIHEFNKEYRGIDRETDVLSFPNVDYKEPANYENVELDKMSYFNPDTEELLLGDIIISVDRVYEQAEQYDHSVLREFSFLVAHSMLHLLGYDHIVPEEASIMEEKQEAILTMIGITRDERGL